MKIWLNCRKAYERLKGGYRFHITKKLVKVYFPNGVHIDVYGRSLSMSTLISILCNGNAHIPARPFMTDVPTILKSTFLRVLQNSVYTTLRNSRNPNDLGDCYIDFDGEKVALEVKSLIKQWLFDGSYYQAKVPNAPKTIRNKGSDVPLVHTGALVNSLTAKVEE